jgi:DNA polymerase-1
MNNLLSYPTLNYKINCLPEGKVIACDTETTGLNPYKGHKPFLYSFSNLDGEMTLVEAAPENDKMLREFFANEKITKVFYNMKFDIKMIRKAGFTIAGRLHDTMVMAKLVDSYTPSFVLENLIAKYDTEFKALEKEKLEEWFSENKISKKDRKYYEVPDSIMHPYAAVDAWNTAQLFQIYRGSIKGCLAMYGIDMGVQEYLIEIEDTGVLIDKAKAVQNTKLLKEQAEALQKKVKHMTGMKLEPSGGRPLAAALFAAGETCIKVSEDSGEAVLDKDTLPLYKAPFIKPFLEMKKLFKLSKDIKNQIITNLDKKHIVHGHINLSQARTGRFSMSGPNLQNQAKNDLLREIFVCKPGFSNYYYDYSQVELRIFAAVSGDKEAMAGFNAGGYDPHQATADKIGITRTQAKTWNFAVLYGSKAKGLSETFAMEKSEAQQLLNEYERKTPSLPQLDRRLKDELFHSGFLTDEFGKQYHIPKNEDRKCVNYRIQGTACNVFKIALLKLKDLLKDKKSNVIQLIHDEIVFEIHETELNLLPKIKAIMEDVPEIGVPLDVDVQYTETNWAEKQDISTEELETKWIPFN